MAMLKIPAWAYNLNLSCVNVTFGASKDTRGTELIRRAHLGTVKIPSNITGNLLFESISPVWQIDSDICKPVCQQARINTLKQQNDGGSNEENGRENIPFT